MKSIHVTFDAQLLQRLDADPEVRSAGRSAVLRRAVAEYLGRARKKRITEAYESAYKVGPGLGEEFSGWEEEGCDGPEKERPQRVAAAVWVAIVT